MKPIGQYRYRGYGIWIVFRAVSVFDKWFIMAFMHYVLTFGFWPAFFLVKSFRHQGVTESWEVRPWEIMSCLQMDGGRKSSWGLSLVAHNTRMGKMDVVSTHWIAQYCTLPATCCIIMRTHIHLHFLSRPEYPVAAAIKTLSHQIPGSFLPMVHTMAPGPLFTKKMPSYQYRDSHYKPETVVRPS